MRQHASRCAHISKLLDGSFPILTSTNQMAILSKIFNTPFPLLPPSSNSSINFLTRSPRVPKTFRQYSKLPVCSIYATAYFLTCSSSVFCFRMLRRTRLSGAARILWIIGNENFPSVRSSHNPLF